MPKEDLIINIGAKADKFKSELDAVSKQTKALEEGLKSVSKKSLTAFAGTSAAIGGAVKVYADYQSALIGVAKTTDMTGKELNDFSKGIDQLSRKIPNLTPKELLNLAQTAGQLGVKGKDNLLKFTETYAKLGTATDIAGEEGAAAIARLLNVTGNGVKDIDKFGDVIVKLGNDSATAEGEILNMATRLSSLANFNASTTEILGVAASLRSVGLEAEAAGTSTTNSFYAISAAINEGGDKLEILKQLTGLTADELQKRFAEDSVGVFKLFAEGLGKIPADEMKLALDGMGLSSVRVLDLFGKLSGKSDLLSDSLKLANSAAKEGTALNKEFEAASKSLNATFGKFKNALLDVAKDIGAQLAPAVEYIVKKLTDLFYWIKDNSKEISPLIAKILKWTAGVTGLTAALGTLGIALIAIKNGIRILGVQTLVTNKAFLAFGATIIRVTGLSRAFATVTVITKLGLYNLGIAGAGAWKKLLLPITAATTAAVAFHKAILKTGEYFGITAVSSEKELDRVSKKLDELRQKEESLQQKVQTGWEFRKETNLKKLDAIQREITAQEGLQKILQKEVEIRDKLKNGTQTASLNFETASAAPDSSLSEIRKYEEEKTSIKENAIKVRLELAKQESNLLKAERQGANEEELNFLKQKNELANQLEKAESEQNKQLRDQEIENIKAKQALLAEEEQKYLNLKAQKNKQSIELLLAERQGADERELELLRQKHELANQEIEIQSEKQSEKKALELEVNKAHQEAVLEQLRTYQEEKKTAEEEDWLSWFETDEIRALTRLNKQIARDKELLKHAKLTAAERAKIEARISKNELEQQNLRVKQLKDNLSSLTELSNSKHKELKAIGKAATIAQIIMKTAESAMNAFAGFTAVIPGPAGMAAGAAAAAALAAYGAEQISIAKGANKGALVTEGITGKDTEPYMLSKGELVVPAPLVPQAQDIFDSIENSSKIVNQDSSLNNAVTNVVNISFEGANFNGTFDDQSIEHIAQRIGELTKENIITPIPTKTLTS